MKYYVCTRVNNNKRLLSYGWLLPVLDDIHFQALHGTNCDNKLTVMYRDTIHCNNHSTQLNTVET